MSSLSNKCLAAHALPFVLEITRIACFVEHIFSHCKNLLPWHVLPCFCSKFVHSHLSQEHMYQQEFLADRNKNRLVLFSTHLEHFFFFERPKYPSLILKGRPKSPSLLCLYVQRDQELENLFIARKVVLLSNYKSFFIRMYLCRFFRR